MFTLNCKGRILIIDKPIVMGIVNTTPDSFYAGSRFQGVDSILAQGEKMLKEGAVILDIGGQSTRPGSNVLSVEEEMKRLLPSIESLHNHFPDAFLSVDTYFGEVAKHAVEAGASIVNDISGGSFDEDMMRLVGTLHVPFVCMHTKGTRETMHKAPDYENVTREVLDYFINKVEAAKHAGIIDVMIDPGFGFSKTISHNFSLLKQLSVFSILEKPLLVGLSRKSTIYKTLAVTADEALNGTTVLNTIGLLNGANILRVHDVKEAIETIKLVAAYGDGERWTLDA